MILKQLLPPFVLSDLLYLAPHGFPLVNLSVGEGVLHYLGKPGGVLIQGHQHAEDAGDLAALQGVLLGYKRDDRVVLGWSLDGLHQS